ncbi:glycosyltransferase family 4 protein [Macrococcus lamae]|uniref:Glycosyltransferase WbuB n=1 Tax=Macrococcus lamae TaxID=198484 RepID=A0A4R6BVH0_9STAP|nr:glycosyltransferase family 4 protein [Macrococcus lamae]TDM12398.1 glycosyltransferase WbuB [Macrococcus lamae]
MKRILIISQNFYPELGSAANRMKNLFLQLKAQGHQVYILTTDPSYPTRELFQDEKYWDNEFLNAISESEIIRLHMKCEKQKNSLLGRMSYYLEFMFKIHYFVSKTDGLFDYIYVTSPNIFVPWGTMFLQPNQSKDVILEIRDLWPDSIVALNKEYINNLIPLLRVMEKKMYNKADKIIVNNESFIPHIKALLQKEKPILFIPNGMTKNEIAHQRHFDLFSVVYTGNLGLAQNYDQLKEIAIKLNQLQIQFNIIPYGVHAEKLSEFVSSHNFEFVHVYPTLTRTECMAFISRHHLALSILKEEDVFLNVTPGKVIDAICAYVPVITNLGGSVEQLINSYQVGFAKQAATSEEMIEAIKKFKDDKKLWMLHQLHTKQLAEEKFSWEVNIEKIIKFMR